MRRTICGASLGALSALFVMFFRDIRSDRNGYHRKERLKVVWVWVRTAKSVAVQFAKLEFIG